MKKAFAVFALIAAMTSAEALQAQTEISARGANIRFGGRVQAQYQNSSVENSEADFFFRRVRLIADAEVTDFWSGRVQADLLGGEANLGRRLRPDDLLRCPAGLHGTVQESVRPL